MAASTRSPKRQRSEEGSGSDRPRKQQKTRLVGSLPSSPPGSSPPGNSPPGNSPPGNSPPGNSPPGNSPPGTESEDVSLPSRPQTVRRQKRQSRLRPAPVIHEYKAPDSIPDYVTTDWSDSMSLSSDIDPSDPELQLAYQTVGARYQAWINGPTIEHCPIMEATLTYHDLFSLPPAPSELVSGDRTSYQWVEKDCSYWEPFESVADDAKTVGLSEGNDWNRRVLRQLGWAPHRELWKWSEYIHWVVEGAIVAAAIMRYHGPHWSEIALAHYRHVYPDINTLKYVYVANIVNKETAPYVREILYNDESIKPTDEPAARYWVHDSNEYQCLLGTAIGKGVASMVLGAWPRGTHRIKQIKSYFVKRCLHLRFDIVEIGDESSASGEKSSEQAELLEEEMGVEKGTDIEMDEAEMVVDEDMPDSEGEEGEMKKGTDIETDESEMIVDEGMPDSEGEGGEMEKVPDVDTDEESVCE
ncbi:unnamed protein product [Penicillium salamii]|uniref:Uncharacterized protein n=1 Tax=Penicillium salamii TaxID=1612424 RepID=A0A9W4ILQ1_9EURO|nr:unnamed protein product [Penicillium salamii]CAG8070831.1 unnamed protein product [Penicillium salamii]CAG8251018.1 unnamed protein product [Penicillium salamii]CAG8251832.1 unnamed protein product [Penicillium salamii]CAG8303475.1 unnamed protein product [Penicillium salamii]